MANYGVQQLLTHILGAALRGEQLNDSAKLELEGENLEALFRLAKTHDLAHIVAWELQKSGVSLPVDVGAKLQKESLLAVYRLEQSKYALNELKQAFQSAGVDYIPLKGSVLREFYPEESMRTSCDIDVLVREESLSAALSALEAQGFKIGERDYHDVSVMSRNNIHIELHFSILENMDNLDAVLKYAWDYAEREEGCRYRFTDEFFAFYILAHTAEHFITGGCGLRALMDLWVIRHKMKIDYRKAEKLLKKAGIYTFAEEMMKLAEECLSEADGHCDELVLDYIVSGGVYGNRENRAAQSASKDGKNVVSYAAKRIFIPYRSMVEYYPVLKKAPILLPAYWVVRCARLLRKDKQKSALGEISSMRKVSASQVDNARAVRQKLGL